MKKSNYDIMRDQAEALFLKYDQDKIIKKFDLEHDASHIYIVFLRKRYQINRSNGMVQWFDASTNQLVHADHNEAMTILDVLCYSRDYCCLSGEFMSINNVPGVPKGSSVGKDFFSKYADMFEHRLDELSQACETLGGTKEPVGDVAYRINLFEFLPIIIQFWDSDDEFSASLKVMWDKNIIDFMHYETTYYAMLHLLDSIHGLIDGKSVCEGRQNHEPFK